MSDFEFLLTYIEAIPEESREGRAHESVQYRYVLNTELDKSKVESLQDQYKITLPNELIDLYSFCYGCQLNEHEILKLDQIAEIKVSLLSLYGDLWQDKYLPFSLHHGVGDYVVFDLSDSNATGVYRVVDAFHEQTPEEWKPICFGIETWLKEFIKNDCQVFWLDR